MGSNVWLWSTTAADNDDADSDINWAEGQSPASVNNSARAMMKAQAHYLVDQSGATASTGAANVYAMATSTDLGSLTNGLTLTFRAHQTNTSSATFNPDGLGAQSIVRGDGSALVAGDILTGNIYTVTYILASTHWRLRGVIPLAAAGDGTVSAPSFTFAADPNTGLYRIGADNIGVAANGAKVLDVGTGGLGVTGYLQINEASAPSTPSSGQVRIYADTSNRLHMLDDGGVDVTLGRLVQRVHGTPYATWTQLNTVIPVDDTIPQITEGDEVVNVSITPKKATNRLLVHCYVNGQLETATGVTAALFIHGTSDAQACIHSQNTDIHQLYFTHEMEAGSTSARSFRLRVGPSITGGFFLNGYTGGRLFGGIQSCRIWVDEYE